MLVLKEGYVKNRTNIIHINENYRLSKTMEDIYFDFPHIVY